MNYLPTDTRRLAITTEGYTSCNNDDHAFSALRLTHYHHREPRQNTMLALPFDLLIPLAHPLRLQAEHNRVQESSTGISWDQLVLSAMQCQAHFLPFSPLRDLFDGE
jgi:hypothetical protein